MLRVGYLIVALFILSIFLRELNAFGFGGMGGGCGGGCGGGGLCGGCGGGCGRKKRSIIETQLKTESTALCPQSEWSKIMQEGMSTATDARTAQLAIHQMMSKEFENVKMIVSCSPRPNDTVAKDLTPTFVSSGEAYCNHANDLIRCTLIALLT